MSKLSPKQYPFGEVLLSARLQRGWSRAELANSSGVGENSIVRYEKAGLEDGGQYPPAPKLAALCLALNIDFEDALLGCLTSEDFKTYSHMYKPENKYGFPLYRALSDQIIDFAHENAKLKSIVRAFILQSEGEVELSDEVVGFLKDQFYEVARSVSKDDDDIFYVDDDVDDEDIDEMVKQNGPGENPSRSNSSDNAEVVGASSISHNKGSG